MPQYDINLREYWRILKKRKFTVLITAVALGVFSTAFALIKAPTPLYTSSCSIKFEKEAAVEGIFSKSFSWSDGTDIETVISVLKGYNVLEKVAERLGKISEGTPAEDVVGIISGLESKIKATRENYSNIINIEVTDADPVFAQRFAKTLAEIFKETHAEEQSSRTEEALKYISRQLKEVRQNLRESEDAFSSFTQENQLVSYDLQSEDLLLSAKNMKDQIQKADEAEAEFSNLSEKLKQFVANPFTDTSGTGNNFYSTYADKQYQQVSTNLVDLLLERDSLLEEFTPMHPEVVAIGRKIMENARKMLIVLRLEIKNTVNKKTKSEKQLAEIAGITNELMEKKLEFDRLKRKVNSFNDMATLLEQKKQEILIAKAEKPEEITIIRPAFLPTSPINQPKAAGTGVMGVIIGFILGMVLAFITETFDTSLAAIEDVEETLDAQVLGIIPHWDPKNVQKDQKDKGRSGAHVPSFGQNVHLVSHFVRKSMVAETFRSLRTNIQFHDPEKKAKTFVITSASPQEGKTMVCINLATIMAQAGMKTLLVGSDLRKPVISKTFGIDASPGLTDVLLGNYDWHDVTKTINDIIVGKMDLDEVMITPGLDNLHIITGGKVPPNPAELLGSQRLTDFVEGVKKEYDIVIFDSPPVLSAADSTILATKADSTLLVYRVGSISRGLLKRARVQLSQVNGNFMGVVLNGIKAEISPDFHDFKYYNYYYYGANEKDEGEIKTKKEPKRFKNSGALKLLPIFIMLGLLFVGALWQFAHSPQRQDSTSDISVIPQTMELEEKPLIERKTLKPARELVSPPVFAKARHSPSDQDSSNDLGTSKTVKESQGALKEPTESRRPYSIHTASFKNLKNAKRAMASLKKNSSLSPYWCQVDLGKKGKWFRLFAGHFMTKEQAEEFIKSHALSASSILKTAYAVQIGEYSSSDGLDQKISTVEGSGSPYVIGNQQEGYRLLTGAFATQKAAMELAHNLKEAGTSCEVVLR